MYILTVYSGYNFDGEYPMCLELMKELVRTRMYFDWKKKEHSKYINCSEVLYYFQIF